MFFILRRPYDDGPLNIVKKFDNEEHLRSYYDKTNYPNITQRGFRSWFSDYTFHNNGRSMIVDTDKCREYIRTGFYKIEHNPLEPEVLFCLKQERKYKLENFLSKRKRKKL